jgi:hypothetical protein
MTVKIFWQPHSFNLDQIGQKRLVDISDGDTPNIRMNVRMLSIDTPETSTMQLKKAEMAGHFTVRISGFLDTKFDTVDTVFGTSVKELHAPLCREFQHAHRLFEEAGDTYGTRSRLDG